jgi:hypothetical protein
VTYWRRPAAPAEPPHLRVQMPAGGPVPDVPGQRQRRAFGEPGMTQSDSRWSILPTDGRSLAHDDGHEVPEACLVGRWQAVHDHVRCAAGALSASRPELVEVFTGLSPRTFRRLVVAVRDVGDAADGREPAE